MKHIIFRLDIYLFLKKKEIYKKFLEKHPHNGVVFKMFDPIVEAEDQFDYLEVEIEAMNMAYEMDIDHAEAILRARSRI